MAKTIREEPEKIWFYNNGITILAEDYDTERLKDDTIQYFLISNLV